MWRERLVLRMRDSANIYTAWSLNQVTVAVDNLMKKSHVGLENLPTSWNINWGRN